MLPIESTRIPRGLLKAIAATVSPTVEPEANRCTRLLPASMTYLNGEKQHRLTVINWLLILKLTEN